MPPSSSQTGIPSLPPSISPASSFILSSSGSSSASSSSSSSSTYFTSFCRRITSRLHSQSSEHSFRSACHDLFHRRLASPSHRSSSTKGFTATKKANKRQIMVALFSRVDHSLDNGQRQSGLEHNNFLWSIVVRERISKNHDIHCFVVRQTNLKSSHSDQSRSVGDWQFQDITKYDPSEEHRLLGHVMIGKISHCVSHGQILGILEALPLPESSQNPEKNEEIWIRSAIHRLQSEGYAEEFDIDKFMRYARDCATSTNRRDHAPFKVNYTFRPM